MKSANAPAAEAQTQAHAAEDDAEEEDKIEFAEDDYTTQAKWRKKEIQNLAILTENFTEDQHDRYVQYRRSALNKNTVRRFVQHATGVNPSANVALVIASFSKLFVGEMVEKARSIQAARGDTGPLAPDHLREAYRTYTEENGKIGTALPQRGKKLFSR